jgi:hypothetical protein
VPADKERSAILLEKISDGIKLLAEGHGRVEHHLGLNGSTPAPTKRRKKRS